MINEASIDGFIAWLDAQPDDAKFNDRSMIGNALAKHLAAINEGKVIRVGMDIATFNRIARSWMYESGNVDPSTWRKLTSAEQQINGALFKLPNVQTAKQLRSKLQWLREKGGEGDENID